MIVEATRIVVTRGNYMGEEGAGYHFSAPANPGDFSRITRGHIQGYDAPAQIEVLVPGEIVETDMGNYLCVPDGTRDAEGWEITHPVDAGEAISRGIARVVEPSCA